MFAKTLLFVSLASLALTAMANAQECMPRPNFVARSWSPYWGHNVVFIGTVTESENVDDSSVARLVVDKVYRGSLGNAVQIHSQGKYFVVGHKYFVYAGQSAAGQMGITFPCGDTRPLEEAADDVAYAEDIAAGKLGTRIYGWVQNTRSPTLPMVGLEVKIRSKKNKFVTKTDEKGLYIFKDIPSGTYSIQVYVPRELDNIFPKRGIATVDASSTTVPSGISAFLTPGIAAPLQSPSTRWANINFRVQ